MKFEFQDAATGDAYAKLTCIVLFQVLSVENVLSYKDQHFWRQSADVVVGTISVQVAPTAIEARVVQQVIRIR